MFTILDTILVINALNFTFRWAEEQCIQKRLEKTGENIRSVLGDSLFLIRFTLMSAQDFVNNVCFKKILTDTETLHIMMYINCSEENR